MFALSVSKLFSRFALAFFVCASSVAFSNLATAASIRGLLLITNSKLKFVRPGLLPALNISASLPLHASLLKMKSGDFAVLSGDLVDTDGDGADDQILVDAIESVGLSELIGSWRSLNWEIVRFEDFSRITLYRPRFGGSASSGAPYNLMKLKELSYTLAPDRDSSYSIFLAEKSFGARIPSVYVGRLEVRPGALKLEIFNPKTGMSSEVLSLSPVRD